MPRIASGIALLCLVSSGAAAQSPQRKDPGVAASYGLLWGGAGHFYAGDKTTGTVLALADAAGLGLAIAGYQQGHHCDQDTCDGTALGVTGLGMMLLVTVASVIDAPKAAERWNAAHGIAAGNVHPIVAPTSKGTRLGLSFRWP